MAIGQRGSGTCSGPQAVFPGQIRNATMTTACVPPTATPPSLPPPPSPPVPPPAPPPSPAAGAACSNYVLNSDPWRSVNATVESAGAHCDNTFNTSVWVRFSYTDAAGIVHAQLPESAPNLGACGVSGAGWLNGLHPTAGTASRTVCFSVGTAAAPTSALPNPLPCSASVAINVTSCGSFWVYQLPPVPVCGATPYGYCTTSVPPAAAPTGQAAALATLSQTWPPGTLSAACPATYYVNRDAWRTPATVGTWCDNTLNAQWYRLGQSVGGLAYAYLPESPLPSPTAALAWLPGGHPSVAQGVVGATVCFVTGSATCQYRMTISVVNCGPFMLYALAPTPWCNFAYVAVPQLPAALDFTLPTPPPPLPSPMPPAPLPPPALAPPPTLAADASVLPVATGLYGWYTVSGWQATRPGVWDDRRHGINAPGPHLLTAPACCAARCPALSGSPRLQERSG